RDDKWIDMYEFLVKYQKENNTIRVPDDIQGSNGLIRRWIVKQRQRHKRNPESFEQDRIQKLEAIPGWSWND
ncbi:MAG: helicase associated domain-containing protein, partial [Ilumatobacteraceae bacterium]